LINRLLGRELVAPKRLCARKLVVRERNTCRRRLQLGVCLRELDFVWAWVDDEKKIAFVDDLAILEVDFRQSTSNLSPQFYSVDGRKLAKKSKPGVNRALQGLASRYDWKRRLRRDRLSLSVMGKAQIRERGNDSQSHACCGYSPHPPGRPTVR
jgi:hypothetical protein